MKTSKGIAFVTGASSGIGAVYADRLAKRGYDLILVARDATRLATLADRIKTETGRAVEVLPADLTSRDDLAAIEKRLGSDPSIALLVNNAGVTEKGQLAGANLDALDKLVQLNVTAVTHLAAAAASSFSKKKSGTIINIASVLALAPERFNAIYCASKAYVLSLTQTLNAELGESGVRIQAVLPGATKTEIWERAGIEQSSLDPSILMDVDDMVDAALAGLDLGEQVTIPSLPDIAAWEKLNSARLALGPNLSRNQPAQRYKHASAKAVA
jgi:short-subunit dehydrogenase